VPSGAADGEEDDENDGWLVPHGYLSDDEGVEGENEVALSLYLVFIELFALYRTYSVIGSCLCISSATPPNVPALATGSHPCMTLF
jgi:hypothetical protein